MNSLSANPKTIENYLLELLLDLENKFKSKTKKSATLLEKQIIQLLVSYHIDHCDVFDNVLYFQLPNSKEMASIDLSWPVEINPDIMARIERNINKIEEKMKSPLQYSWTNLLLKKPEIFSLEEIFKLKKSGLIEDFIWDKFSSSLPIFYQPKKHLNLSPSQYSFKIYCLLLFRALNKNNENPNFGLINYKEALKLFTEQEKVLFRKKVKDHHYFQPTLNKVRGTLIESILNDSLINSHADKVVFYEEESHKPGFDLEVITKKENIFLETKNLYKDESLVNYRVALDSIKISSKTGNVVKKGVIHLSSSRTQKALSLSDKINHINLELSEISIITACVQKIVGNKKIYLRLALDPWKLLVPTSSWEQHNKNGNWNRFVYKTESGFMVTITKSKSDQVDFFIPIDWFDVIDEFEI